jgi:hypothetical protein
MMVINSTKLSTKRTIISHLTQKNMTCDVGNPGPGLGQAQKCGGVKPVNGISCLLHLRQTSIMPNVLL